jgi:hypothetical protein
LGTAEVELDRRFDRRFPAASAQTQPQATGNERRPPLHHPHHSHVLQLDIQGTPQAWISLEHAALHVATGSDKISAFEGLDPVLDSLVKLR